VASYRRVKERRGGGGARRGTMEGGAAGSSHGKGAASPACRGSAVGNRRPHGARVSGMGGFRAVEGDLAAGRSGPVGVLFFGAARR
jgi:hypothetical protein